MIKPVQAFQTSDNKTFTDKVAAIQHEFDLELRGVLQRANPKVGSYTCPDVTRTLIENLEEFQAITKKYKNLLGRNKKVVTG